MDIYLVQSPDVVPDTIVQPRESKDFLNNMLDAYKPAPSKHTRDFVARSLRVLFRKSSPKNIDHGASTGY